MAMDEQNNVNQKFCSDQIIWLILEKGYKKHGYIESFGE